MQKLSWGIIVIILVSGVLFLMFGGGNDSIKNYPPRAGVVAAFGDSLVFGTGASAGKDFVSVLSEQIGKPIENFGIPGDTTEMALARIDTVIDRHPSVVLVLLGGNDYLRRLPREQTFKNLDAIVSRLQDDGAVVLLLGVRGGIVSDGFESKFEALSKRKQTAYVPDILDGLLGNSKLMSDEIHPNDEGYSLIAKKIYPVLIHVLP